MYIYIYVYISVLVSVRALACLMVLHIPYTTQAMCMCVVSTCESMQPAGFELERESSICQAKSARDALVTSKYSAHKRDEGEPDC